MAVAVIVMTVTVTMTVPMMSGCECLLSVVPGHISKDAVLDIASEKTLLAEGCSILLRVNSPPHLSAEKEGTVIILFHLLLQVVLEQRLGLPWLLHLHYYSINKPTKNTVNNDKHDHDQIS